MGAGGVKNFSVGICDGAPSTARSSSICYDLFFSQSTEYKILPNMYYVLKYSENKFERNSSTHTQTI